LVERCGLASLKSNSKWIGIIVDWVLQLEVLLLVIAKMLKSNNTLEALNQNIVSFGPSVVAMFATRCQIADDPRLFGSSCLRGRQLSF
jgi:hypothetical protein